MLQHTVLHKNRARYNFYVANRFFVFLRTVLFRAIYFHFHSITLNDEANQFCVRFLKFDACLTLIICPILRTSGKNKKHTNRNTKKKRKTLKLVYCVHIATYNLYIHTNCANCVHVYGKCICIIVYLFSFVKRFEK